MRQRPEVQTIIANPCSTWRTLALQHVQNLPIEVFDQITSDLNVREAWWLTQTIGIPSRFHYAIGRRIRLALHHFFTDIGSVYRSVESSGACITGNIVLRMLVGGHWEENDLDLIVSNTHWEYVLNLLRKEGYELEPPNDTLAGYEPVEQKMFVQGDKTVMVNIFDPTQTTQEGVAAGQTFTAMMSTLTSTGFIIPFPELTFACTGAIRDDAIGDADVVCAVAGRLASVGIEPLMIANRVISTRELQRVSRGATTLLEQKTCWCVEWKPRSS